MTTLTVTIHQIRGIKDAELELPFDSGIYTIVGSNGCGKSTLLLCLSQLLHRKVDGIGEGISDNSFLKFQLGGLKKTCRREHNAWVCDENMLEKFNGLYEGSLFYGTRFQDSTIIEKKIASNEIAPDEIIDADTYMKERISYILHGDLNHYTNLKRVRNRHIASKHKIKNLPYFNEVDGRLISQYRMSSGECLLISLMHFLYNSMVRRSLPEDQKVVVLIDELELALHPIAVRRLMDYLHELAANHSNMVVFLSTHSPEVIKSMRPINLYKVINIDGNISIEANCYPSYLIRDLYSNVSPDFLLLVEDELAQLIVNRVLTTNNLRSGKLIHCVPVGGWRNVLELHRELYNKKVLGNTTKIISILDGDIQNQLSNAQKRLPHFFLPIPSVEKFIYSTIRQNSNPTLRRIINDKYFIVDSLENIVAEYNQGTLNGSKDTDKNFYTFLINHLQRIGTQETTFVSGICDEIIKNLDFSNFTNSLTMLLQNNN